MGPLLLIFAGLALVCIYFVVRPIQTMPVYVMVPTNGTAINPAWGTNIVSVEVPYATVADKLITEQDVDEIKKAIPRTTTTGLFYSPYAIHVSSSSEVEAIFYRGNKPAWVRIDKTKQGWEVESVSHSGQDIYPPVPSLGDKLNQRLPF